MKALVIILAVIGGLTVLGAGGCIALLGIGVAAASDMTDEDGNFRMPTYGKEPVITKAEFDRLREGMSYSRVVHIVGARGSEESSISMPGIEGSSASSRTVSYRWTNPGGSNASVMFQDNKLMMKSQFGLP